MKNKEEEEDNNEDSQEESEYKKIHCRFYEQVYPQQGDLVYVRNKMKINKYFLIQCKVDEILDYGAFVKLLEYDGIRGLILSGDITRKRVNLVNRLLKVGKDEVFHVVRVDVQKGFIDLSKKTVKPEEIAESKKYFAKSKTVDTIMRLLAVHTKKDLLLLNQKIAWPLYKKYEHAYDGFKLALNNEEAVLKDLEIEDEVKKELINILKVRMVAQPVKIYAHFKLTCCTFEGIDAIKEALLNGEKKGTKEIPIKFRVIGPPVYECYVTTINKNEGMKIISEALIEVEKTIRSKKGGYHLEVNPTVLGEAEESLADQLKAKEKEKEENEKEEEDEEIIGILANIENEEDDIM